MTVADDIRETNPASLTEKPSHDTDDTQVGTSSRPMRKIGPESEVRGGSEAPADDE